MPEAHPLRAADESLPWLADLIPSRVDVTGRLDDRDAHALLLVTPQLGRKAALARQLGRGEAAGIDVVHAGVRRLLERGALPSLATLHVRCDPADTFAESVVAGISRACRGNEISVCATSGPAVGGLELVLHLVGAVIAPESRTPKAGDQLLALRSAGPVDGDIDLLRERSAALGLDLTSAVPGGDHVGDVLTAARRSHIDVVQQPLREQWPSAIAAVESSLVATAEALLPAGLGIAWELERWAPPSPFSHWFRTADERARAAQMSSCGAGMIICCDDQQSSAWQALCEAWNEPATPIARIVAR